MLVNPNFIELNNFKRVHCAKGSDLFARIGKREPSAPLPSSDGVIPLNQSKLDMLEDLQSYDRQIELEHAKKMQDEAVRKLAEDSSKNNPINE